MKKKHEKNDFSVTDNTGKKTGWTLIRLIITVYI